MRIAALWVVLLGALPGWGQANLLSNGDFETDLSGWNAGGATRSTAEAHLGAASARLANAQMDTTVSTTAGTRYKVTAWVKLVAETGTDWGGFRVEAQSSSFQTLGSSGFLTRRARGGAWFKVAVAFTAVGSQTRLYVGYFGGAGRQQESHADDVQVFVRPSTNTPPTLTATLTPAQLTSLPGALSFDAAADDPDGAVRRVEWRFGDGTRALVPAGTHRVASSGSFVARVRVSDDDGALSERSFSWSASDPATAPLTVTSPAAGAVVSAPVVAVQGTSGPSGVLITTDRGSSQRASGPSWSAALPLAPGWNRVLVQTAAAGSPSTEERRVRYVPAEPLALANVRESSASVERWRPLEVQFELLGSAATHPQFPFDPAPAPGLEFLDGVTVDAVFSQDGFATAYRRAAFVQQRFLRAQKSNEEWLYPDGPPVWTARFAPPETGAWSYRLEVTEAKGRLRSDPRTFTVTAATAGNHGPLRVSAADGRYFEHADCTPFLGTGHGIGTSEESYGYELERQFGVMGPSNQQLFRFWISGDIWGSAWQAWRSRTLGYDGTVPHTGLSLEAAYADGLVAERLDPVDNPIVFQGWLTGHSGIQRGRSYRIRARWRTEGVTGPAVAGRPFGLCVRWTAFPEVGQTHTLPLALPHVAGDSPWHVAEGTFVASGGTTQFNDYLANPSIVLENATGGTGWVDEVSVRELLPDAGLGGELLRSPNFNQHLVFDPRRAASLEAVLAAGLAQDKHLKLVISEKQEFLLNALGADGLPDRLGGAFNGPPGSPARRLHEHHWRHLLARFGAYSCLHSLELVNEEAPGPGPHFALTTRLAQAAAQDGNPHLGSTSTWSSLAEAAWKAPSNAPISYVDFHAYVNGTGWLGPKNELADDSARLFIDYDRAVADAGFGKPVVWGEQGIDGTATTDQEDPALAQDDAGVWLHKLTWARTGPGGVYPLYWYTQNIRNKGLHPIYGSWRRFMQSVPLTNGRYVDAQPQVQGALLRAVGQKDVPGGRAHLWLDNRPHTWRAVVTGTAVTPASGSVSVDMGAAAASAAFTATWFDTATGQSFRTESLTADAQGAVTLAVAALGTDVAVQLERTGHQPPPPPACPPMGGRLPYSWSDDGGLTAGDSGTAVPDGGEPDGGQLDAGEPDGGSSPGPAGSPTGIQGGSCACSAGGPAWALALLALRRRRRR